MFSGITLKQISTKSGYSISTVSKALNDRHEIKESTKIKIREIAKKNNYVPNNAARALRNKKTKVLAVIIPKITNSYFNLFVCEIQKKAFSMDYRIVILQTFDDQEKEKKCIKLVNDGSVDGIVLFSNHFYDENLFNSFHNIVTIPYHQNDRSSTEQTKELAYTIFIRLIS